MWRLAHARGAPHHVNEKEPSHHVPVHCSGCPVRRVRFCRRIPRSRTRFRNVGGAHQRGGRSWSSSTPFAKRAPARGKSTPCTTARGCTLKRQFSPDASSTTARSDALFTSREWARTASGSRSHGRSGSSTARNSAASSAIWEVTTSSRCSTSRPRVPHRNGGIHRTAQIHQRCRREHPRPCIPRERCG